MSSIRNQSNKLRVAVVSAVDSNPRYKDCRHYFEKSWNRISRRSSHEYIPIVVNVTSEQTFEFKGQTFTLPLPMDTAFIAQNVRSPAGSLLGEFDLVMTSDIDMFPLDPMWFDGLVELCNEAQSFTIGRNVLEQGQYPICYNIAKPSTWAAVFGVDSSSDLENAVYSLWQGATSEPGGYDGKHGGHGWHYDQTSLFRLVNQAADLGTELGFYEYGIQSRHRRLDRALRPKFLRWLAIPLLRRLKITDYHTHLPIWKNRTFLEALMEVI